MNEEVHFRKAPNSFGIDYVHFEIWPYIILFSAYNYTNKSYSLDMTKYYRGDDGVLRTGFDQAPSINCNRRVGGTFNETKQN